MSKVQVVPTQKYGYIDIKQSSKVRPRKIKSWKHRWAVLTQLSNLSSEEYVAKLDLYDNENKWRSSSSDKTTFVLENVTCIKQVKSKTHQHAFEVVESQPVLVISGATELESYSWILSLQLIFTPEQIESKKDSYEVTLSANEHSKKWNLSGEYILTVSSACISLESTDGTCDISWSLNTLVRFNVVQNHIPGQMATLVIECGPNAPTGQSKFHFLSHEAEDIIGAIKQSICMALALKQNARSVHSMRQRSMSATVSEKCFQYLLENDTATKSSPKSVPKNRSDSGISTSTTNGGSPTRSSRLFYSPASSMKNGNFTADMEPSVEVEENIASDCQLTGADIQAIEAMSCQKIKAPLHKRSSSHPNHSGYSEIKDVTAEQKPVSRRNTVSCEPPDFDLDRLRSVSDVVASLKADHDQKPGRSFYDNDDKSDLDSAISSMALSTTNDELSKNDIAHSPDTDCAGELCLCALSRRRSSSTPDLQEYWKMHTSTSRFDNVYEDLDELRASVQRLNMKRDSDTPPELPARPYSIPFTYNSDLNTKSTVIKRQSSLKCYGNPNYDEVKDKAARPCTCDNLNGGRARFDSSGGHSTVCGGQMSAGRTQTHVAKTSTTEKLGKSYFSSINDINDIILKVQNVKRRRSSDITPVASSFLLSTISPDVNRSNNLQPHEEEQEKSMQSKHTAQENLINLQERTDNFNLRIPAARPIPKSVQNTTDSSTRFFLDEDNFSSNPIVKEKDPAQLAPNFDHVIKSCFSFPDVPDSSAAGFNQTNRTWTWHGQNAENRTEPSFGLGSDPGGDLGTDPSFGIGLLPINQSNILDIWDIDTAARNKSDHTTDTSVPTCLLSPFSQEPLI